MVLLSSVVSTEPLRVRPRRARTLLLRALCRKTMALRNYRTRCLEVRLLPLCSVYNSRIKLALLTGCFLSSEAIYDIFKMTQPISCGSSLATGNSLVAQPFSWKQQNYYCTAYQQHISGLEQLCRVCGERLGSSQCSYQLQSILSTTFGIRVDEDNPLIHPPRYRHRCRGVTYHTAKKGELYKHQRQLFSWTVHASDTECTHNTHTHTHTHTHKTPSFSSSSSFCVASSLSLNRRQHPKTPPEVVWLGGSAGLYSNMSACTCVHVYMYMYNVRIYKCQW